MMLASLLTSLVFPLPQNSVMAAQTDTLYDFISIVSVVLMTPVIVAMVYFAVKYREGKNKEKPPHIEGNKYFEWGVSVFLSVVFLGIFGWGVIGYYQLNNPPPNTYDINVIGQQWQWTFQYANGKTTTNELVVPKGVPVRLIMTSRDVIHNFFIPNLRIKKDVVPGMYTQLWFTATEISENQVFCAQYCGTSHSGMLAVLKVMEPLQFKAWLVGKDPTKVDMVEIGKHLFFQRNCVTCHDVKGSGDGKTIKAGPTLKGVYGRMVTLADGQNVTADDNYLRNSIMNPGDQVAKGFRAIMPTYKGLMSEEDINALVAYIKSLKE